MAEKPSQPFPLGDGEYGQLAFLSVDIAGSENLVKTLSSQRNRDLLDRYKTIVQEIVEAAGGVSSGWQGDGAVAFFGTRGDEDPLIRQAEEASRKILERLFNELPSLHIRIGLDSRPARFFADVGRITSEGVVLATRLQSHGRKLSQNSVLLISHQTHAALDPKAQKNYTTIEGPAGNAWLYNPPESASFLAPASGFAQPPRNFSTRSLRTDQHLWEQDTLWPFPESRKSLSFILTAQPLNPPSNSLSVLNSWIREQSLKLPLSGRVFEDEGQKRITFFTVESRGGPFLQFCRFYEEGAFAFGDASWPLMPGWSNAFYPETAWLLLADIMNFLKEYYRQAGASGEIRLALMVNHVTGCERKMTSSGNALAPFQYTEPIYKRMDAAADSLWPQAARELYERILNSSGIPKEMIGRLMPPSSP